jgi:signal transduction histidine kinase/AraC-like DNA-binding protein
MLEKPQKYIKKNHNPFYNSSFYDIIYLIMNMFAFKKNVRKEKYYSDFIKLNTESLYKFNRYCALFCIIKVIIDIIFIDPVAFPGLVSQMFTVRSIFIISAAVVLTVSLIGSLKKFSAIIAFFFNLSVMMFCVNIILVTENNLLQVNTWILIIVLFVGLYPIPVSQSITVFFISFFYFLIFSIIKGNFIEAYKQLIFINTFGVAIATSIFKYFLMQTKQNEFYVRKDLENANKEIKDLNEKLQSFDKIKTDFFSDISHEIRTPLTLFKGPIESYFDGKIKINDIDEFLSNLLKNARRLSSLVNNLLDFSKLDAGRMNLLIKETDISKFIKEYVNSFGTSAKLKNLTLEYIDKTQNTKVFIDQDKIDKVFMNIFSNALKFTDSGGKITVRSWDDAEHVFIEFSDNGPGIPATMIDAVFERYRRVDLNPDRDGSGIGLALAREYMTMHGGKITLESNYYKDFPFDHGSVFTLVFLSGKKHFDKMDNIEIIYDESAGDPKCPEIQNEGSKSIYHKSEKNLMENEWLTRPSVLLVEDNSDMANFIAGMIGDQYDILFAGNGREAIDKLTVNKIDLVLSDIMMPEMDGYMMLKAIRLDKRYERLPVIMLTAKADDKMKLNALEHGANDYITKPFNAGELIAKIRTQIHLKLLVDKLLDESQGKSADDINVSESLKNKLEHTIDFLNNNYLDIISRENLAATLGMSPDYFGRIFKKYTGKKVLEYINDLRIKHASDLLASSNKKIIDIAMESGFETLRTFNRDFTKKMELTPSEYRLKNRK